MERYINPFTDFGFKKIFGEEANKDLLIDFLNELLKEKGRIKELTFLKTEHLGASQADRKAIFDLYCENERGEKFIVELQKAKQKFFKDRSLYYSTFPIQEQAKTDEWDFKLENVYTISIMDFVFATENSKFIHDVWLIEKETQQVFNERLRYIYLEMPKFKKKEEELETHFEKWLYVLRNLAALPDRPDKLQERIFDKVFRVAEIAQYSQSDRQAYQDSLKYYRDNKNVIDTAFEQGEIKGKEERNIEIAKKMILAGYQEALISELTDLTLEQIRFLRGE